MLVRSIFVLLSMVISSNAVAIAAITFDANNFTQNIKAYAEQLNQLRELKQQTEHHILQSKHLFEQAQMQKESLKKLKVNNLKGIYDSYNNINGLLTHSQAVLDRTKELDKRYAAMFGAAKAEPLPSEAENAMLRQQLKHSMETNRRAMNSLKVLDSYKQDQKRTKDMVEQSQHAAGQMQAMQSANQLAAMQIKELQELKLLMAENMEMRANAIAEENTAKVIAHQKFEAEMAKPVSLTRKVKLPKLK